MKLTEALKMNGTTTENGMSTNTTSLNFNVAYDMVMEIMNAHQAFT
jgi:hypothetical protein